MLPDEALLECRVKAELGVDARVCVAQEAVGAAELSAGEVRRYRRLGAAARQSTWLKGRMALKTLLRRRGENEDTTALRFPNPRFSLTHCRSFAVAVETRRDLFGIGVDLELDRVVPPAAARFFLTEPECRAIDVLPAAEQPAALLRLWTVKEALYKADPDNAHAWFTHYAVDNPRPGAGRATVSRGNGDRHEEREMRYTSFTFASGYLSFAVCLRSGAARRRPLLESR